jgi:hypothetical protein
MFILHTKDYHKHLPKGSAECAAVAGVDMANDAARHLYGKWGHCKADQDNPTCLARVTSLVMRK